MHDIWAFLLQTLAASSVAVVLLVVKVMFRDKLSPKWQFAIWGILGCALLIPVGSFKRYILMNWPLIIETVKTIFLREYTLTRVSFPFPIPVTVMPRTVLDWLFVLYEAGVVFFILRYVTSYIKLQKILQDGTEPEIRIKVKINLVAGQYDLPICESVRVKGITSAFVCGVFHPVLVLPEEEMDDKVILHELLHLKYKDTIWGILIALFRCIHWCNPLIWYCADQVGNDIEALCDYRVLTLLEGEERRDYGRILLAMANEKYARMPGTSSMANGGKHISKRIASIVRFKKYPSGMQMVSVCIAIVIAIPMLSGVEVQKVYGADNLFPEEVDHAMSMASSRLNYCTTPAGALDTYGKALLTQNGNYRTMCAPADMQESIAKEIWEKRAKSPNWDSGLECPPDKEKGYSILNMRKSGNDAYCALMVLPLAYPPDGQVAKEDMMWIAFQKVRVEKEDNHWIVMPAEEFKLIEIVDSDLNWGSGALPAYVYSNTWEDFRVEVHYQQIFIIDNIRYLENKLDWFAGNETFFDTVPKPNAEFDSARWLQTSGCVYTGDDEKKDDYHLLGLSVAVQENLEGRPQLIPPGGGYSGGSDSDGNGWRSTWLEDGWDSNRMLCVSSGGSSDAFENIADNIPAYYAADLYINGERVAEMTLQLQEGGVYE